MKPHLLPAIFMVVFCVNAFAQQANRQNAPCTSFPCIVASIALTSQSMSVSEVPIYTPTTSGVFRVTYYFEADAQAIGGSWLLTWSWTDDLKPQKIPPVMVQPGEYFSYVLPIRDLASHPIAYSVMGHTGGSYNLFATVEQVQ
jgi:hypothetical protein